MKEENIKDYLEENEEMRPIAKKNEIIREFIVKTYPGIKMVLSDNGIENMVADIIDIDRKIRLVKQKNPSLRGNTELEKAEYEEYAKEQLGYTHCP